MTGPQNLNGGQDSDAALRAQPEGGAGECGGKVVAIGRVRKQLLTRHGQQPAAQVQLGGAVTVGQEAVIADALETWRQDVLQEASDKFLAASMKPCACRRRLSFARTRTRRLASSRQCARWRWPRDGCSGDR